MSKFDFELVGKIGSMALVDKVNNNIDYNVFARVCQELKPGCIWVSSGATEIGRIDYLNRGGEELSGKDEENKIDYAAQGQAILMQNYRQFISNQYNVRQVLVEHFHFNDSEKRQNLVNLFLRCKEQNAIPIVNYNDAVSFEEVRKMEIQSIMAKSKRAVECVDNDETASQIACLVKAKTLLILSSVDGIYVDRNNPDTLIQSIYGKNIEELIQNVDEAKTHCEGASRKGANGAGYKLEYIKEPLKYGATVIIANAKYKIKDILNGKVNRTIIQVK